MVKRRPPHCEEKGQPLLNKRKKKRQYNEPPSLLERCATKPPSCFYSTALETQFCGNTAFPPHTVHLVRLNQKRGIRLPLSLAHSPSQFQPAYPSSIESQPPIFLNYRSRSSFINVFIDFKSKITTHYPLNYNVLPVQRHVRASSSPDIDNEQFNMESNPLSRLVLRHNRTRLALKISLPYFSFRRKHRSRCNQ